MLFLVGADIERGGLGIIVGIRGSCVPMDWMAIFMPFVARNMSIGMGCSALWWLPMQCMVFFLHDFLSVVVADDGVGSNGEFGWRVVMEWRLRMAACWMKGWYLCIHRRYSDDTKRESGDCCP